MTLSPEVTRVLVDLVEGRLDPVQWDAWWAENGRSMSQSLNPGQALRFRMATTPGDSPVARIAQCQAWAAEVLRSKGVPVLLDPTYAEHARRELLQAVEEERVRMKRENRERLGRISRFDARFPDFAAFLRRRARDLDELGPPASPEDLGDLRDRMGGPIPPSLLQFLGCTRSFSLGDLIQFHVDHMQTMSFDRLPARERPRVHGMFLLCEFWLNADGDQLVLDHATRVEDECPVLYYGHAYRPPRVTPVASSFDGLVTWWARGTRAWTRTLGR